MDEAALEREFFVDCAPPKYTACDRELDALTERFDVCSRRRSVEGHLLPVADTVPGGFIEFAPKRLGGKAGRAARDAGAPSARTRGKVHGPT